MMISKKYFSVFLYIFIALPTYSIAVPLTPSKLPLVEPVDGKKILISLAIGGVALGGFAWYWSKYRKNKINANNPIFSKKTVSVNDDGWGSINLMSSSLSSETVAQLLNNGAKVNVRYKNENTPLMLSSFFCNEGVIQLLIKRGATVNARNIDNTIPLMIAARFNTSGIVQLLLDHGADINAQDSYGTTSLMDAINSTSCDSLETVKLLLARNADPLLKNKKGKTAKDIAQEQQKEAYSEEQKEKYATMVELLTKAEQAKDEKLLKPQDNFNIQDDHGINKIQEDSFRKVNFTAKPAKQNGTTIPISQDANILPKNTGNTITKTLQDSTRGFFSIVWGVLTSPYKFIVRLW